MSLPTLPITYVMYLTTEGYAGCSTLYRSTLDHTDRQLPLSVFRHRLASIKITPGRESVAEAMKADLATRGFEVITATAPWERGLSHYAEFLKDKIRVSQHDMVAGTPFIFETDHDYPIMCYRDDLLRVLTKMAQVIDGSPNVLSMRFLRAEDADALAPDRTVEIDQSNNLAWSKHFNFQPALMRSRDYFLTCRVIENNWEAVVKMHGEALWREVMKTLTRSHKCHAVWLREYAEVINLGVPNYAEVAERLRLTIYPNPS